MTISKASVIYKEIRLAREPLTQGRVICIDPSIGSTSSMPGWAFYSAGEYINSGVLRINPVGSIPTRLQALSGLLRDLYSEYHPEVLVYEKIAPRRYGRGGNASAHASLLKAVGTTLSVAGPEHYVGMIPTSWKRCTRPGYTKSDENDAIEMGWIAIDVARTMLLPVRDRRAAASASRLEEAGDDE